VPTKKQQLLQPFTNKMLQCLLLQSFEMDERAVFLRFELFSKRLTKLITMFTTFHQFSSLEQHTHITGETACAFCCSLVFTNWELRMHVIGAALASLRRAGFQAP
jgi:hypothetical protein